MQLRAALAVAVEHPTWGWRKARWHLLAQPEWDESAVAIIAETGSAPGYVRCDNEPELTAEALASWCDTAGVETAFIDPGSSWQNGLL